MENIRKTKKPNRQSQEERIGKAFKNQSEAALLRTEAEMHGQSLLEDDDMERKEERAYG